MAYHVSLHCGVYVFVFHATVFGGREDSMLADTIRKINEKEKWYWEQYRKKREEKNKWQKEKRKN